MDPTAAFVIVTVMTLLNGAILGLVGGDLPRPMHPSARDWRVSSLLIAGGCIFLAVQAYAPPAFILPVANGIIMLGFTGYWRALRRFYGQPDTPWLIVPPVVATVGIYWFAAHPNLTARVIIATVAWLISLVGATRTLRSSSDDGRSRRVLAGVFVVVAFFMLLRAVYFVLANESISNVTDRAVVNVLTSIVAGILPVIGTTAFILLCSDRIRRDWERAASTDYLTGLANRRTLGREGDLRVERARAYGDRLAIAVVDVDHFKSINDRFGHDVGDLALKHVAAQLRAACRGGDLPARHGGEEFVILFDRIEPAQAKAAGERMRLSVADSAFFVEGREHRITVSIGVASLSEGDRNFDDLLRRADHALYAAKTAGRNRVELAA